MIEQQNNAIANRDNGRTLPEVYEVLIDNDRNVLARDEPTRTCWGPLPSRAPTIKTLEKFATIFLKFFLMIVL